MIHAQMAIIAITYGLEISNILLAFLVYKWRGDQLYKFFGILMTAFLFYSTLQLFDIYGTVARILINQGTAVTIINSLYYLGLANIVYAFPRVIYRLGHDRFTKFTGVFFNFWALLYPAYYIVRLFSSESFKLAGGKIIVYLCYLKIPVFLILAIKHYRKIGNLKDKAFIKSLLILTVVFLPLYLLQMIVTLQSSLLSEWQLNDPVSQLYLFCWSVLCIKFLIRHLLHPQTMGISFDEMGE